MNSSQKKQFLSLDLRLFEPAQMAKDGGVEQAILDLEKVVYGGETSQAIIDLFSNQNQFEYVFSVANDGVVEVLRQHMLDWFPSTAAEFASSHFASTMPRLASYLYFLSTEDQKTQLLADSYRIANSVPGLLEVVSSTAFHEHTGENSSLNQQEEDDALEFGKKKRNQRHAKQLKKARKAGTVPDPRLLEASRIARKAVPTTKKDADDLVLCLLDHMKSILCDFLDLLRDATWTCAIRESYIPSFAAPQANVSGNHSSDELTDVLQVSSEGTSSAFPAVQPLKAALHFDNAKGFGNWRIFISNKAEKHLREHRKNPKIFKVIVKKIRELSHGHFSADNQKRLKGPDKGVPIFEAKMTGDLRLVYHVDCSSDYETEVEWQGLRIFGVFTHAQMDERMWASLSAQLVKRGPEYRRRVILRSKPTNTSDNVFEPLSWPDHSVREEETKDDTALLSLIRPDDLPNIHQWIVLEKYTAFSQALLNCILADKAASAVFTVSPYERAVIEHPSSCYVLGRSGTGKTTTMLFKIFGIERSARLQHAEIQKKPRQLFVTQSRVLAGRVKDYFDKLSDFLYAASVKSLADLKELGHSYEEIQHDDELGDPEDDEEWRDDLPKRFSELEDKHFPLFLTFDKLCKLIEGDLGLSFGRQKYTREHRRAERRYTTKGTYMDGLNDLEVTDSIEGSSAIISNEQSRASLVTYEAFCSRYWPHFPQNLTKGLDTALVFNEFLGVIKGSEECLISEKPYLSRETYLGLSERSQSTFASQRTRIYDLFVSYLKLKQQYDDYDSADRSFSIISHLKDIRKMGVDYLYVDEAQDNLIIDALLLRSLCSNPNGLFWAGDTAQTIAVGSSFRFDDLKASLHRFETSNPGCVTQKSRTKPVSFQLTTNYRSHGGIVNCAEMVIRLIKNFWPHSIDVLRQEKGLVNGEKPVIITGWNEENARYEQFLLGENGGSIEFGAQQCILVRHDQARNNLRKQVGEIGVILTLYESKGLEFDDVLLFDFFEDSLCDASQWRVILNYGTSSELYGVAPPTFDEVRHAGICTELKFLYVAMTRARKNLWIIDRSEKVEPMKVLLRANGRVTICTPEMAPDLSVSSTTEEWAKTGKELFRNQRYSQAMHCFERSGHTYERSIAEAYHLRQQARIQHRGRRAAFTAAAKAFCACAEDSPASNRKKDYFRIAGDCYREADDFGRAARAFLHAEEYNHATRFFRKAGMFDDAVDVIKTNRGSVDQVLAEEIIDVSKVHYFHENKLESAMELFESKEEGLSFMEEFGFDVARGKVLETIGRKCEAAELYFSEGHQSDAMRVLLSDPDDASCIQQASTKILDQLWRKYAFSSTAVNYNEGEVDYEVLAGRLNQSSIISSEDRKQLEIFSSIKKRDAGNLFRIQNETFRDGDMLNTTLVLNHYMRYMKSDRVGSMEDLLPVLEACMRYAYLLHTLMDVPHTKPKVQKLLGFTPVPDRAEFAIDECSFLYSQAVEDKFRGLPVERSLVIHELDMANLIRASLTSHLRTFVREQNQSLLMTRNRLFGTPCLNFATRGTCYRNECQREHVDIMAVDVHWYNLRVRLHYLQILHIGAADFALGDRERRELRGQWIANLFEIFHPSRLEFGSLANLSASLIPETQEAIKLITYWLEDSSYSLNSTQLKLRQTRAFLDEVLELVVTGLHYNAVRFRHVIQRSKFYDKNIGHPALFRQDVSPGLYVILDLMLFVDAYGPHFLNRGTLAVKHVVGSRLPIEINHLCHLFEQLCSCYILIFAFQKSGLHNCTLPRSWMRVTLQKLSVRPDIQLYGLHNIWIFLDTLFQCLRQLVYEQDSGISLLNSSDVVRKNTSIARLCQCIVLLGYNLGIMSLREKIVGFFSQLRREIPYPPWPLKQPRYIYCKGWHDLSRIVRTLVPKTRLDNMVQLIKKGRTLNTLPGYSSIVRIEFAEWADILPTLSNEQDLPKSRLSATAIPFTPKVVLLAKAMESKNVHHAGQIPSSEVPLSEELVVAYEAGSREEEEESEEEEEEEEEEDGTPEVLLEKGTEVVPEEPEPVVVRHSEAELAAANNIWEWYERAKREQIARSSITHREKAMRFNLAQHYARCLKVSLEKTWSSSLDRILFLALSPHVLVCLHKVQDKLQADRKRAIKVFNDTSKEGHMEYEEVLRRVSQTSQRRKQLDRLKKFFNSTSIRHTPSGLEELRRKLRDIESLIDEVKVGDELEVTENLWLAKKATIEERKVVFQEELQEEPKAKPELNTEDIYEFEDY